MVSETRTDVRLLDAPRTMAYRFRLIRVEVGPACESADGALNLRRYS